MKFLKEDRIYLDDYGTGNIENNEYFDVTKSEASKYTDYLQEPEKTNKYFKTTSSIEMLSPKEYLEECAKIFDSTFENQYKQVKNDIDDMKHLRDVVLKYKKKFPITVLNYAENTQEGRHRMATLGELFGWDKKYPVLIIRETPEGKEYKKQQAIFRGLNRLTNRALEFTFDSYEDAIEEIKYHLDKELKDYYDYEDLDIILTKKPSIIIQVDNVSYEIEDHEINIDPDREKDDLEDLLDIEDLLSQLSPKEREMFKFNN